ncbi:THAP domain-containing protein 1-like [Schistocerca gregaria]|uniref:THAP domain-containing protein 1-like n=1 Tax=Schistocerca gregaria TaxID=7010 RepID=UPI00211F13ED|nr:THAP domain-containing protein 1-like [Schistocerca gregaria]
MVISCSAYNCTNRQNKESNLIFHRFPLQKGDLLKQWVIATRRKGFTPTRASSLCGDHFLEEDYLVRPGTSRRHLKPDEVPSQFAFPTHLMPKEKQPRLFSEL